ncbi:hypothetical protein Tco_0708380 [Tanacetum coccineum]
MSNDRIFCQPFMCERCRRNYTDRFCSICCFESGNAFIDDLITNSFDDLPNSSDHSPQSQYQTNSCELCGDNAHYEDIECKDSYDSNLDELTFLVTPLSDSDEDECLALSDDIELLLHHDSSISVVSILEGFTDEPSLEENDDYI